MSAVESYLSGLAPETRTALEQVRRVILARLPDGYEEQMIGRMIAYVVPHVVLPQGYHCDPTKPLVYAALMDQKNSNSLYLMGIYGDEATRAWFLSRYADRGRKVKIGKACLSFKTAADLDLDLIGECIARISMQTYVERYLALLESQGRNKAKRAGG